MDSVPVPKFPIFNSAVLAQAEPFPSMVTNPLQGPFDEAIAPAPLLTCPPLVMVSVADSPGLPMLPHLDGGSWPSTKTVPQKHKCFVLNRGRRIENWKLGHRHAVHYPWWVRKQHDSVYRIVGGGLRDRYGRWTRFHMELQQCTLHRSAVGLTDALSGSGSPYTGGSTVTTGTTGSIDVTSSEDHRRDRLGGTWRRPAGLRHAVCHEQCAE